MINCIYKILFLAFSCHLIGQSDIRRIGRLADVTWEEYFALGSNQGKYASGQNYPDLSVVGALVSNSGEIGTATLIAPNIILTAAHVVQNIVLNIENDTPKAGNWKFYMGENLQHASSSTSWYSEEVYTIKQFFVHEGWTDRQILKINDGEGDGDFLGVDIAIAVLDQDVVGYFPARLPNQNDDPNKKRTVLSGYGTLVHGSNADLDPTNKKRTGAENFIDRSVEKVSEVGVDDLSLGGLLGIDFDSPLEVNNTLGDGISIDKLGVGDSDASPLPLEASTAKGDSGGPAFVYTNNAWRIHGVVSYGTSDSTYGDVTIYTRVASHHDWIHSKLPNWHNCKILGEGNWRESPWLGPLFPYESKWNFFTKLGWMYVDQAVGEALWGWSYLMQDWIWFSSEVFPYVYCYSLDDWMYLSENNSNALSISGYDFSLKKWKTFTGK